MDIQWCEVNHAAVLGAGLTIYDASNLFMARRLSAAFDAQLQPVWASDTR